MPTYTWTDPSATLAAIAGLPAGTGYTSIDLTAKYLRPVTTKHRARHCQGNSAVQGIADGAGRGQADRLARSPARIRHVNLYDLQPRRLTAAPTRGTVHPEEETMPRAEFRVLYVLGMYHSGTTLLGNLAGQLDGYFSVGELRSIWRKLTLPHTRCGCGDQLAACPVWQRVFRIAFGAGQDPAALAREMRQCQQDAVREFHTWRQVPSLLRRRGRELPKGSPLARYTEGLARLYQAIAEETGAEVIVDSSKEPTDAALLLLMPTIDSTFVHLVRDPRGVVHSILRVQAGDRPVAESRWRQSAYTAFSWSAGNVAGTAVRRAAGPARSTLLRYEDFVAKPHETIEALARGHGKPARFDPAIELGAVTIGPTHTVGGNNNRFRTGPVLVREDTAWRSQSHRLDKAVVTTVCAPLMRRYGYRLTPERTVKEPGPAIAAGPEERRHA